MTEYRRPKNTGATWFFTVNLAQRHGNRLLVENIDLLRNTFHRVKVAHPFRIDAIVVLPDHLHCIWTLPLEDSNYATRWALIKAGFSRGIAPGERRTASRVQRGERGIWQRRFWEHRIRDNGDLRRHVDYVHWNPVIHRWSRCVADWPYSSFDTYVRRSVYAQDWAGQPHETIEAGE